MVEMVKMAKTQHEDDMNHEPLPERLIRIEDEISLLDSSLDARTRKLWQAFDMLRAQVEALRNQVERPSTR